MLLIARKKRSNLPAHSLYRILDLCSASMEKSLQGLDNFTAAGAQAFQNLESVVHTLEENGSKREWG